MLSATKMVKFGPKLAIFVALNVWVSLLSPAAFFHVDGSVASMVCGDTRFLDRRLPAGRTRLVGIVPWRTPQGRDGNWVALRTVRVVHD